MGYLSLCDYCFQVRYRISFIYHFLQFNSKCKVMKAHNLILISTDSELISVKWQKRILFQISWSPRAFNFKLAPAIYVYIKELAYCQIRILQTRLKTINNIWRFWRVVNLKLQPVINLHKNVWHLFLISHLLSVCFTDQ